MFRVLHNSIRKFHPDVPVQVWTYGGDYFPLPTENVEHHPTNRGTEWIALSRAQVMMDTLSRHEQVVLMGADCELYSPLDRALEAARGHDITLVPFLSRPLVDPHHMGVTESYLYTCWYCNTDFVILNRSQTTFEILDWLHKRINWKCEVNKANGYNNEQGWLSIATSLFPGINVWRNMCFNVARWNYDVYNLRRENDGWVTDGGPLGMYHWSQFNFQNPSQLHPEFPTMVGGEIGGFFYDYSERVQRWRQT
jgi:hypothetical protein